MQAGVAGPYSRSSTLPILGAHSYPSSTGGRQRELRGHPTHRSCPYVGAASAPASPASEYAPGRHLGGRACRRVTAVAPGNGGIIDVWYGNRWAVVACDDDTRGGGLRVFPSLKIASALI